MVVAVTLNARIKAGMSISEASSAQRVIEDRRWDLLVTRRNSFKIRFVKS
jgi:hypothetical protein